MKFLALIQARCGSSRLPGKVMRKLGDKTVLEWVMLRAKRSQLVDEVMVVTSIEKNNLPIIKLCVDCDTRVYVGSENDVLDRYYQAAKLLKPEYVIRITADCPVFDYNYLDMALRQLRPETDYMCDWHETFPDGLDIEIIRYDVLKQAWEKSKMLLEREHVTLYIRRNKEKYCVQDFVCPISGIGNKRWTLDEEQDYILLCKIYDYFLKQGNEFFATEDIMKLLKDRPDLNGINDTLIRNDGFLSHINEDREICMD